MHVSMHVIYPVENVHSRPQTLTVPLAEILTRRCYHLQARVHVMTIITTPTWLLW